ncbi:MAG: 4a-hydroxytetrahydrobiopterin dehydratase [Bacteroidetes bacterium]|nr:4a-hydroxytetrahydrobiopterin dehydratase [Bacteroidota bacterium]MCB0843973.1 4a-hydroxytetrahydrobiopterin dehydratase [Bacteroidota bacterium]MCB0852449.1 4a-hydroxytetrahydrobiopterin dehydratase [Bacteroidota bacterium]
MRTYNQEEAEQLLDEMEDWEFIEDGIEKSYEFDDFVSAFSFMTIVAMLAEKANHHPEWSNIYNQVHIRLSTHDAGGVTEKDFELAREIDGFISEEDE